MKEDPIDHKHLIESGTFKTSSSRKADGTVPTIFGKPARNHNLFVFAVIASTVATAGIFISNFTFEESSVDLDSSRTVGSKFEGAWSVGEAKELFNNHDFSSSSNNNGGSPSPSTAEEIVIHLDDMNKVEEYRTHQNLEDHSANDKKVNYHSYYSDRFPTYTLPPWAKKSIPYPSSIPIDKQICFVHVGKAGGSTIGCSLGFSLHCSSNHTSPNNSLLAPSTTHTFHRGVYDCSEKEEYFLFVVRDPLARVLSAFNYDRPESRTGEGLGKKFRKREFYLECPFWRLEDVAQLGLLGKSASPDNLKADEATKSTDTAIAASPKCRKMADEALKGIGNYLPHWYFNYQYYYEFLPQNVNLLVIRNEHMVQDWNSIEALLSTENAGMQAGVASAEDFPYDNSHKTTDAFDLFLSDESKVALCRALCNEIQVYKTILRKAVNLKVQDVESSIMDELKEFCPTEALNDECKDEMPDIFDKIEARKGAQ
ncbi:hypothetical protein ACHAXS_012375 [Conticribra weissflogii]